jgi:hypothetical protein
LLTAPELAIDESEIDRYAGRHARDGRDQGFAVRFTRCGKAQHREMVIVEIAASI